MIATRLGPTFAVALVGTPPALPTTSSVPGSARTTRNGSGSNRAGMRSAEARLAALNRIAIIIVRAAATNIANLAIGYFQLGYLTTAAVLVVLLMVVLAVVAASSAAAADRLSRTGFGTWTAMLFARTRPRAWRRNGSCNRPGHGRRTCLGMHRDDGRRLGFAYRMTNGAPTPCPGYCFGRRS